MMFYFIIILFLLGWLWMKGKAVARRGGPCAGQLKGRSEFMGLPSAPG